MVIISCRSSEGCSALAVHGRACARLLFAPLPSLADAGFLHVPRQAPAVPALNLLAGSNSPVPLRKIKFDEAPMLRPGLVAVIAEAAKRPAILGKTSPIPQIAPRLYADTPWSTWQPIPSETGLDS